MINRSIALVGLMGAGKTSVGRKLAELLRVPFCDTDDEITTAAHMSIPEIFSEFGEAEFRSLERRVAARVMAGPPQVVSTGGGAFVQDDVRNAIQKDGVSVWLNVELDLLWKRLQDKPGRPLLANNDPKATLAALLAERGPVYQKANVTVTAHDGQSQTEVAKDVIRGLIAYGRAHPERQIFTQEPQA